MEYEIIKKDGSYRIMYKKGDDKVLSNHFFKTEDEAINFIFRTENTSQINLKRNNLNTGETKTEIIYSNRTCPLNGSFCNNLSGGGGGGGLGFGAGLIIGGLLF